MADHIFSIKVKLSSPCHPHSYLQPIKGCDRPNELQCSRCKRRWLLGVCIPMDELFLYSVEPPDAPPAPPLPGEAPAS